MLSLFDKIGKGCILYKSRKIVIEVANNRYKGSFKFFDNLRVFHKIFILSIILVQSLIDLT